MRKQDLTGQRFNMFTVIREGDGQILSGKIRVSWICKCDCGKEMDIPAIYLKKDYRYSCGCTPRPTKSKFQDLTGQRFGRLVVLGIAERRKTATRFLCKCDCGNETVVLSTNLKSGHTQSCGCWQDESRSIVHTKHGMKDTRLYGVWGKMKDRCLRENNPSYPRYGGRGITICDEWLDFASFAEWAMVNGYDKDAPYGECTLDRIDNNKGYSPDNCRWVNEQVQANNRRSNKIVTYNGESHTVAEWSRILGIKLGTLTAGLWSGIPFEHYVNDFHPRS